MVVLLATELRCTYYNFHIYYVSVIVKSTVPGSGGNLYSGLSVREWVHDSSASRKPCEHHISKTNQGNVTQFWSQMHFGS